MQLPDTTASEDGRCIVKVHDPKRRVVIEELEAGLDRILFRVMDMSDMPDVERQIRRCRRLLVLENLQ
jgi:hypothetical protein